MKKNRTRISVIVPVFNGEAFLAEALDSIFAQAGVEIEALLIDDGSTDGTAGIARNYEYTLRYKYQENSGPSAARNAGLAMAQGEYIAFLDADDLWPVNKLELALNAFNEAPDVDVVIGRSRFLRHSNDASRGEVFEEILAPRYYLQLGSALFRRCVFDRVGLFNTALRFSEDIDWFIRASELGVCIQAIDAISLFHRLHGGNITRCVDSHTVNITRVLKSSLDRRRKAARTASPDSLDFLFANVERKTDQ